MCLTLSFEFRQVNFYFAGHLEQGFASLRVKNVVSKAAAHFDARPHAIQGVI